MKQGWECHAVNAPVPEIMQIKDLQENHFWVSHADLVTLYNVNLRYKPYGCIFYDDVL